MAEQPNRQFRVVESEPSPAQSAAAQAIMVALTALSQRFIVALANLFTLLTVASAFILTWAVLPNPSIQQLVGLGTYYVFILAVLFLRRK